MFRKTISLILFALLLGACSSPQDPSATPGEETTGTEASVVTDVPPTEAPTPTPLPSPDQAAIQFFEAFAADDFDTMYALTTPATRSSILPEDFTDRYLKALGQAAVGVGKIHYEILSWDELDAENAQVNYRITWTSSLFGDLTREHQMNLKSLEGSWQIVWDDSLVFPDLANGNVFRRIYYPPPARGDILDRDGDPLVAYNEEAYALGLIPARINRADEENMLNTLTRVTGLPADYIWYWYYSGLPDNYDFYVPFTDADSSQFVGNSLQGLQLFSGVQISPFSSRYYYGPETAPHALGFTSFVQPDEQIAYERRGFWWTSRVPRDGIELWAESYLGGEQGGALFVDGPDGSEIEFLAEKFTTPSSTVYTTFDDELQAEVQKTLLGFSGAIVVMERDTGRVLAMASSPSYSPNLFEPSNPNATFDSPYLQSGQPILNRAVRGQYPLGSVFKVITLSAALESGLFSPDTEYDCQFEFTELVPLGPILYDWTYTRWLDDDEFEPSGILTLPEGLMRSCNPWFYHIGLKMWNEDMKTGISDMARAFGLGQPTGIVGIIDEDAGQVVDPTEPLAATNLAVGQGDLLVTPIQVANFMVAIGNGGTFYQPQLVEKVVDANGNVVYDFAPIKTGELPISEETLTVLRGAMEDVTYHKRGTAITTFGSFPFNVAGKTGTAQAGGDQADPHSWFAGYTYQDELSGWNGPADVVVVVIAENSGEGSVIATPIARRVLEIYYGRSYKQFEWEKYIGLPETFAFPEEEEEKPTKTP